MILGNIVLRQCYLIQSSISHYYYTATSHWFVGILCAVAMFLISYRGYNLIDNVVSSIAGFTAVLIAFFPTNMETMVPEEIIMNRCVLFRLNENAIRNLIHYISAGIFFLSLAYNSLFLFTKSGGTKSKEKLIRNKIYKTCGIVILTSIILIAAYGIFKDKLVGLKEFHPIFWLEWLALIAFGISWLVKGEIILKDADVEKKH